MKVYCLYDGYMEIREIHKKKESAEKRVYELNKAYGNDDFDGTNWIGWYIDEIEVIE